MGVSRLVCLSDPPAAQRPAWTPASAGAQRTIPGPWKTTCHSFHSSLCDLLKKITVKFHSFFLKRAKSYSIAHNFPQKRWVDYLLARWWFEHPWLILDPSCIYLQFDEKMHSLQMHKSRRQWWLTHLLTDEDGLHTRKLSKAGVKTVTAPHLCDRNGAPLSKAASAAVIISFLPQI